METDRPSSAKWVSRRTLDSQAHNRDHSTGMQQQQQQQQHHPRGHTPRSNMDNINAHNNNSVDRRKNGHLDMGLSSGGSIRGNGGGGYRTNSGNSVGGAWGGNIASNPGFSINKVNQHSTGYPAPPLNAHPPQHNPGSHHSHSHNSGNGNGGRRGYNGGGGGYSEPVEPTMPPPPRSVQIGQGTLPAHSASRDHIPQPRHAKLNANASANAPRPMVNSGSATTLDAPATRRWASAASTPTPRSVQSNPGATAATHHDPHTAAAVPRSSPSSPFTAASSTDARSTPAAPPLPPPAMPGTAAFAGNGGIAASTLATAPMGTGSSHSSLPPPMPRSYASSAARPAVTSPLEALRLSEHLLFDTEDFDEPATIQPSEIEELLGQVERSTAAAAAAKAPRESVMGGSLRDRRSATDWGIEEAIKSVLPGMDEDDNWDDAQGPNLFSGGMAAISGSWHTSGEPDTRQPHGVGLLADFPTSFAASFSEPVSAVLGSAFQGDPATTAMDNLSRVFSTAARVDSSSFTTSPATTYAATPLQLPPTSPGQHLPHYTSPDDVVTMPPSTRDIATHAPPSASATHPPSTQPPPPSAPGSVHRERQAGKEEAAAGDSITGTADLLTLFPHAPPSATSPWLSSGVGEGVPGGAASRASDSVADRGASKASSGSTERHPERPAGNRTPHQGPFRPTGLPGIPMKNASMDSSAGLTASMTVTSPGGPPTRQSTLTTSAPDTPSLRKESSTPLSSTRSQAYTPGGSSRPQRPSLSAPAVNRQTIAQIFRETPQSLARKEKMAFQHEHNDQSLCKDVNWPPHNDAEVDQMLRSRGATKLLRHLTIVSFSRQHVSGVQELFDTWAKNGIPAPDMAFGAYYYYVKEKSDKLLCMKHNGRGPSPGHGYGRCDFESRRPYSTCRYEHVCLFCRSKEHGWFEEGKCQGYQQLLGEMEELGITEEDVMTLLNAMERTAKTTWLR